ncbi:MAG: TerC family protein [Methanobacteriota archaeon]
MISQTLMWAGFFALIAILLALDLGVFQRKAHTIHMKEAVKWTVFWIAIGISFSIVIWLEYPATATGDGLNRTDAVAAYLTGYVLEKMLSVDNLFVFVILFSFFGVKSKDQHHVLFWGIMGALVMRGIFIFAGTAAIHAYEPVLYFFGGLLIYTAIKMAAMGDHEFDPSESRLYKFMKRILPFSEDAHDGKFFHKVNGRRLGTCLLLCLAMVELTDVLFAIDSVPAVLGITSDTFIVYTSNVFAILGLRALYFVVAGGLQSFKYLKPALVVVLAFIGIKMILAGPPVLGITWMPIYEVPILMSLAVVVGILGIAIIASVAGKKKPEPELHVTLGEGCPCGRQEEHAPHCSSHPDNKK